MKAHLAILRAASWLAPRAQRAEWVAEWRSELWYVAQAGGGRLAFCLGAFRDACWLRRNSPSPPGTMLRFESPWRCALFLAALAALSVLGAPSGAGRAPLAAHLGVLLIALSILPATTSLSLGECAPRDACLRRWLFLGIKLALLVPIVFFGSFAAGRFLSTTGLQAQALLVGYVFAFRWALIDQRARCPICLRLLANPTRIGEPSHVFLAWYGTVGRQGLWQAARDL